MKTYYQQWKHESQNRSGRWAEEINPWSCRYSIPDSPVAQWSKKYKPKRLCASHVFPVDKATTILGILG